MEHNEMGDMSEDLKSLIFKKKRKDSSTPKTMDKNLKPKKGKPVSNFSMRKSGEFHVGNQQNSKKKSLKKRKKVKSLNNLI